VDIGAGLHGDDTELILFVNPDEESLVLVMEDTTTVGPVTVEAASLEEAITLPIKRLLFVANGFKPNCQ
jgi:hypothetical protein